MPIYLLETLVNKRLEYLKSVFKTQGLVYSEYMIDGSVYDIVGHFMLCIIVILEDNADFTQFFIKAEEILFKYRLKALLAYDLRCFAKKLLRQIRKIESNFSLLDPLRKLCQHLLLKHTVHHISSISCCDNCSKHFLQVYFTHCLSFIADRQVELKQGLALIPCSKWKNYLISLFKTNLKNRVCYTNLDTLRHDPRIIDLLHKVRKSMILQKTYNINILMSYEVDNASKLFPPCMLNLHQHLRQKHRLSHDQRFCYSLFLKDVGMPVNQAISFWKAEYEKSPNGKHNCCHNWERDEKRFMYGIRHLYGLEGGRKHYQSQNCQFIQAADASCSEGGCPFKSFDEKALLKVLEINETDYLFEQIKNLQKNRQYNSACISYMQSKFLINLSNNCDLALNFKPIKYFMLASNKVL
ncbi:unnamed protein product, partial [Brenthis ino]